MSLLIHKVIPSHRSYVIHDTLHIRISLEELVSLRAWKGGASSRSLGPCETWVHMEPQEQRESPGSIQGSQRPIVLGRSTQ